MKKVMLMAMAVMVAGIVSADLSINWANSSQPVYDVGGSGNGGPFVAGAEVDLIWSTVGAITTPGLYNLAANLGVTEFVLDGTAVAGTFGFFAGGGIYTDANVGGNNVNSGFFFTRIYQPVGNFFLDIPLGEGGDFIYEPTAPLTTFSANAVNGAPAFVDSNGTQVVPEPATLGLMGIAGLGMFLARRKARR